MGGPLCPPGSCSDVMPYLAVASFPDGADTEVRPYRRPFPFIRQLTSFGPPIDVVRAGPRARPVVSRRHAVHFRPFAN